MAKPEIAQPSKDSKYDDYAVEDACRTLMRAEEIKADSKMMALVRPKLKKQKRHISSIEDLRAARNEMAMEGDED